MLTHSREGGKTLLSSHYEQIMQNFTSEGLALLILMAWVIIFEDILMGCFPSTFKLI